VIPQAYLAGAAALSLAAGGLVTGWKAANWRRDSQALAIEQAAKKAGESATQAAVTAIKGIEVKYVTIRQNAETVTREVPVYRDGTCNHDPRMRDAINAALAGPGAAGTGVPGDVRATP
jgi:hypothetical protein